jgi:hypothetical protein
MPMFQLMSKYIEPLEIIKMTIHKMITSFFVDTLGCDGQILYEASMVTQFFSLYSFTY